MTKGLSALAVLAALALAGCSPPTGAGGWWTTADQRGDRLEREGRFDEAAEVFDDPFRRGVALYRVGAFERAATAFLAVDNAEARYNRGNALVLLGRYADAVAAYDGALALRPAWREAEENRALARARGDRLEGESGPGTGGMLGADEVVFDEGGTSSGGDEVVELGGGPPLSDAQIQALWLRRVRTKPADFFRSKFAHQARRARGLRP